MLKKSKVPTPPPLATTQMPDAAHAPAHLPVLDNALTDTLTRGMDFAKNLWGGLPASIPGFVVPTMDVKELDKRITDLRAVESWLALNANLLRTTIQSLEVQRNTIAAIQSFGGNLGSLAQDLLEGKSSAAPPTSARPAEHRVSPDAALAQADAGERAAPAGRSGNKIGRKSLGDTEGPTIADPSIALAASGSAWLSFLEEQFNRIALSALSGAIPQNASKSARPSSRVTSAHSKGARKTRPRSERTPIKVKR